ncbi:MAG: hypothetical protein QOF25_566 [Mycobacterium sp.]|nr:hypothetical protein [Mycobacterium sp.]
MLAGDYPWTKPHGRLNNLGPTIPPNRSTALCDERIDGCWLTRVGRNAERVGTAALHRCSHGCPKNAVSCQLPGHSPDHFSNSRAPWRSITVFTTEKIAPWTAAATRISLNE